MKVSAWINYEMIIIEKGKACLSVLQQQQQKAHLTFNFNNGISYIYSWVVDNSSEDIEPNCGDAHHMNKNGELLLLLLLQGNSR